MTDDSRRLRLVPRVEESTVRRIVRVLTALSGLLVVLGLVAALPGIDRLLAAAAVSPGALLLAFATLLVTAALVWVAPTVETVVAQALDGPEGAVTDAAVSAKLLVGFAAVGVAHRGLAPVVEPLFAAFDIGGLYDLAFLAVGLAVLGAFVRRFYRCWAPVTDLLTDHLTTAVGADSPEVSTEQ